MTGTARFVKTSPPRSVTEDPETQLLVLEDEMARRATFLPLAVAHLAGQGCPKGTDVVGYGLDATGELLPRSHQPA